MSGLRCRGNVLELLDDIQELKPHMFCSVPRLWNRIYDRVNATIQASNPISRKLFETAYNYKKAALDRGDLTGGRMAGFWDKLVFSKIKARIGGVAHFVVCFPLTGLKWSFIHMFGTLHRVLKQQKAPSACT